MMVGDNLIRVVSTRWVNVPGLPLVLSRKTSVMAMVACLSFGATRVMAKDLALFDVPLKGATRTQLRQVFKQNGLQATREEDGYWVDEYDANGVLEGATKFDVGYLLSGKFAYAQYTFQAFMDTDLVGKVIHTVAIKYGRPSMRSGSDELGPVTAKWNMGQGMQIQVTRGWPDTTTYLKFIDVPTYGQMNNEIKATEEAQNRQKAQAQTRAF